MHSVICWTRWLVLVLLLTTGCSPQSKPSTATSGEDGDVKSSADGAKAKKGIIPVKQNVKEIPGNWVVVLTNGRTDTYRWIVKFLRGTDGKVTGEFIDSSEAKDEADKFEIAESEVNDNSIRLVIKNAKATYDFVGTFQEGFIRGTMRSSPFEVFLARLLPTDEKSLERFGATGLPPGSDVFEAKMKSKDFTPLDFFNTVREYRTSPLAQDLYSMLMKEHVRAGFNEEKVKEVIDAFLSSAKIWGERWEARMEMAIAIGLINGRKFARLAPSHIDAAEQKLGDDIVAFKDSLAAYRDAANVSIRVHEVTDSSSTDEIRSAANAQLVELLKKQRFNAEILLALATEAERTEKIDAAIEYYSDIVAIPMLEGAVMALRAGSPPSTPTPSEALKKLWAQKHNSEEGYQQHISEVYHERMDAWLAEIQKSGAKLPADDAGNKTVLMELFTGMMCPPCISADVALDAISRTFPTTKVIVLRYHQHIPKPDGLVNEDGEERYGLYELSGTPAILLDGMLIDPRYYAGMIQNSAGAYGVLRNVIDLRLAEKTDVVLQLSAVVTNGELTISAEATGIPEDSLASCRLRMAIVENNVVTDGPMINVTNGIRDHEFVVRKMPGGAKGIPSKNGELKYSLTMPVAELQERVVDFITRFEAGRRGEFPAELKPPIRGPLSFAAWVQNGNADPATHSKLVLQSAMIPVTGDTGFDAAPATTSKTKEMPDKATTPSNKTPAAVANAAGDESSDSTPPPPALPE